MPRTLNLPDLADAQIVVAAPAAGPGNWAGAASAVIVDGVYWLTYRVRRPLVEGRGVTVTVARSDDGIAFETVAEVHRDQFGSESFERPVLVPLPGGGWRLYLSCATKASKHWWVDSLTAATPQELPHGHRRIVLPGDDKVAVKDPVIRTWQRPDDSTAWSMWLCCHPLDVAGAEDRMTTRWLTSDDGLEWTDRGEVLAGRMGHWDERGARVATVLELGADGEAVTALYDGRADAASNWFERTGVATSDPLSGSARLIPAGAEVLASPHSDGACRYAASVEQPDGSTRYYLETARPDGAHDLVTCVSG